MAKLKQKKEIVDVLNNTFEKEVSKEEVSNNSLNKDGFKKGSIVTEEEYFSFVSKNRSRNK